MTTMGKESRYGDEWFRFRKHKISASTAAAFLRLDFRTTREDAFERLLGELDGPVETVAMQRGTLLESAICEQYAATTGTSIAPTGSWPHAQFGEWLFASPDRLVWHRELEKLALLEVKSVSRIMQTVPNHHLVQVQIQLACAGVDFCDYVQSDGGAQLRIHRVRRDEELIRVILTNLYGVYEAARPALEGRVTAEDVFVDDVSPFGRREQQELQGLMEESRRVFVLNFP